jgi:hypothetical protein
VPVFLVPTQSQINKRDMPSEKHTHRSSGLGPLDRCLIKGVLEATPDMPMTCFLDPTFGEYFLLAMLCFIVRSRGSALCYIAQSCDMPMTCFLDPTDRLDPQHKSINSGLCIKARSHDSALCYIAPSCDSAVCCIARSHNSVLCFIAPS